MMRLVRDQSLIFADLGDLRVLIASSALLSDRAGEGLATVAFAVGLGAAFTRKDVYSPYLNFNTSPILHQSFLSTLPCLLYPLYLPVCL